MAEYARAYGGPPDPEQPWPLFLALSSRAGRFDSRLRLQLLDSVAAAIGAALGGGGAQHEIARDSLLRSAYPTMREGPPMALIQSWPAEGAPNG